jgi:hypothetical protein
MLYTVDIKNRTIECYSLSGDQRDFLRFYFINAESPSEALEMALDNARTKLGSYYRTMDDYQKPSNGLGVVSQYGGGSAETMLVKASSDLQSYLGEYLDSRPLKRNYDGSYE